MLTGRRLPSRSATVALAAAALLAGTSLATVHPAAAAPGSTSTRAATDRTPPPVPTIARAYNTAGVLNVWWDPMTVPDLAGFNVYARFYGHPGWTRVVTKTLGTNLNPEIGPDAPVKISPTVKFTADTGDLFQVAMTSVDTAGNESAPSRVRSGATRPADVAVFDADTDFGNFGANLFSAGGGIAIDHDVTWGPALAKVIVVKGALRIKPGSTLTVLPGTVVTFEHTYYPGPRDPAMGQGAVIVPAGAGLVVKGTAAKPVIVTKTGDPTAGPAWSGSGDVFTTGPLNENWYGVVAAPGARVVHSFVQLRHADHGFLRCAAPGDAFVPCPAVG